jgi:RNA polymerase sigma-70 factor (ECF subfamily)
VDRAAEPGDAEIVERVRRGDEAAFDLLVERHIARAFSVGYRLLGNREDAQDVVQESFLAVLERIETFEPGREFGPWFYRIVVNRGLNARKSLARRATMDVPLDVPIAGPSPLRLTEQAELATLVHEAMTELPERQRDIVRLFELEGFPSGEIAEMLGIADGTVRWHLHEARQRLRRALDPYTRQET